MGATEAPTVETRSPGASRPVVFVVDDEPGVARAVERDLRSHLRNRYRVLRAESGSDALEALGVVTLRGDRVALFLVDQRMPGMSGVEFLERARELAPGAKRVLLTAYADTQAAIDAINKVALDHYLLKPWDPPEEQLYPVVDDLLGDWEASAAPLADGVRIVGQRRSRGSHELKDFLARNQVPFHWLDVDRDPDGEAAILLRAAGGAPRLPLVVLSGGDFLEAPTTAVLAERAGITRHAELPFYDLLIVGGGPAGLAAAVYGASEGLATAMIEREAPGGQAGQSSRIENYLGFPVGLSGADLARRATTQARRFGAELLTVQEVSGVESSGSARVLTLGDGSQLSAHAVLIATGVDYRRLDVPGIAELTGRGVYYGGSRAEAISCQGEHVVVVGGANSAGQAAIYFAGYAGQVTILCRGFDLANSMSSYLVDQIDQTPNIDVRTGAAVVAAHGGESLEAITVARSGGTEERLEVSAMFVFIGAQPQTGWLGDEIARDEKGFVLAGPEARTASGRARWPLARDPYLLETSLPGVFVAGDVRASSIKRVASAVGEGSMAVQFVHDYIGSL